LSLFHLLLTIGPRRSMAGSRAFVHQGQTFYRRRDGAFLDADGQRVSNLDACFLLGQSEALQRARSAGPKP
jgi:hypothetical protein